MVAVRQSSIAVFQENQGVHPRVQTWNKALAQSIHEPGIFVGIIFDRNNTGTANIDPNGWGVCFAFLKFYIR